MSQRDMRRLANEVGLDFDSIRHTGKPESYKVWRIADANPHASYFGVNGSAIVTRLEGSGTVVRFLQAYRAGYKAHAAELVASMQGGQKT